MLHARIRLGVLIFVGAIAGTACSSAIVVHPDARDIGMPHESSPNVVLVH